MAGKKSVKTEEYESSLTKKGRRMLFLSRFFVYLALIFLSAICLFTFAMLIINATRTHVQLASPHFSMVPGTNFIVNLKNAWNDLSINIPQGMVNSFIIAICGTVLTVYFSALTAYAIHCYRFKGRKAIYTFILVIMMIPSQVSAVGFVQMVNKLNLINTYWPLIIPGIAAPVVFFYMKTYMESILPLEIVEAARVDGSGEFRTFNQIVLPILKPAIAVQAIFSFVGSWNNYFTPALIIDKAEMKTVPIMIAQLRSADYSKFDLGKMYMFIFLAILPVIAVYLILSKFIIKNVTSGAVKG